MATSLTYGSTTCLLDATEAIHLTPQAAEAIAAEQIAAEVRARLAEPIGYPSLAQATIPGDRVALAIASGIPQKLSVIDGVLQALDDAGVEQQHITLLHTGTEENATRLRSELASLGHGRCRVKVHDPDSDDEIAYLGATQRGDALRLNRDLCEADFVLPITVTNMQPSPSERASAHHGWLPDFADRETINRFASAASENYSEVCPENLVEMEECGRQLGVGLTLQVVPAPGAQVASLVAGDPHAAEKEARSKSQRIWRADSVVRAKLAIATISGNEDEQTWQNVARAITAAEAVLEPDGMVVVCSEITEMPGIAISRLAGNEDYSLAQRDIARNPSADSFAAMQLCRALQHCSVYLRSQLRPSVVESLGITPIGSDIELERLSQAHRPCVILEDAQHLLPCCIESGA